MKNRIIATAFILATITASAFGQAKPIAPANSTAPPKPVLNPNTTPGTRARVLGNEQKSAHPILTPANSPAKQSEKYVDTARARRASEAVTPSTRSTSGSTTANNSSLPAQPNSFSSSNLFANYSTVSMAATQTYKVGVNDVLDIQISGKAGRESTLYTVTEAGLVEFPLAGDPVAVAGLTTTEIAALLKRRIRLLENPAITVNVRDYASHAVTVTGFVAAPGRKILRREAVPLYAMLAEALVLPDAGRATITRSGRAPIIADLKDSNHMATLIVAGDMIKVSGAPPAPTEYFFIGGAINSPGQKPFHTGLTLTQALLASGGATMKSDARIRVSRLGPKGRLITEEHNFKKIQNGKIADPVVQKGDRIEVIPLD